MAKRIAISKTIRFEVLKRDKFSCQYCGASAPNVILNVDHINPVANGGDNSIINLITACFECNNGKRDKLISDESIIIKQKDQLAQLQIRREQLEMMFEWHKSLQNIDEFAINELISYWENLSPGFSINEGGRNKLKKLRSKFTENEILEAMDVASKQYFKWENDELTSESCEEAFLKIGAILTVKSASKDDPVIKDLYYIRGILKKRLNYVHPSLSIDWMKAAISWGGTIQEIKNIAMNTKNWTSFSSDIDSLIDSKKA